MRRPFNDESALAVLTNGDVMRKCGRWAAPHDAPIGGCRGAHLAAAIDFLEHAVGGTMDAELRGRLTEHFVRDTLATCHRELYVTHLCDAPAGESAACLAASSSSCVNH